MGTGGGIWASGTSTTSIWNSIVSGNRGSIEIVLPEPFPPLIQRWPQDCAGAVISNGYNVVRDNSQGFCQLTGAVSSADPLLGPLTYHGGLTRTRALPAESPAIDGVPAGFCNDDLGTPFATDQRGGARPSGASCDLGAFELGGLIFSDAFELGGAVGTGRWSATQN